MKTINHRIRLTSIQACVTIRKEDMDFIKQHGYSATQLLRIHIQELMEKENA